MTSKGLRVHVSQEAIQGSEITQKTGHLGTQGHPWGTEIIGVSGLIRGPWGFNQETRRGDTMDFKDQRGTEQRAPRGWAEVTKSIQGQRSQVEVCSHPGTRTVPLRPFWEQPRNSDPQGSGCHDICGRVWLGVGPSGETLGAWTALVPGLVAQHRVGGHSWVNMESLGMVAGVPPRGNDGAGGSDLPPSGWAGAWGSSLSALSTLSLAFLGDSW